MTIHDFLIDLSAYRGENVFNPWGQSDALHDIGDPASAIRRVNLGVYLELRSQADYIFMAEALGYQGGHFSGVALTSERMLLGYHAISPEEIFGQYKPQRTSDPAKLDKEILRQKGFNEPTDTVVWQGLRDCGFDLFKVVFWNIFPFHPYNKGNILSNRTPSEAELELGYGYFIKLKQIYPNAKVVAIGKKCQDTLAAFGMECPALRHPSMGGANEFRSGLQNLKKENG